MVIVGQLSGEYADIGFHQKADIEIPVAKHGQVLVVAADSLPGFAMEYEGNRGEEIAGHHLG